MRRQIPNQSPCFENDLGKFQSTIDSTLDGIDDRNRQKNRDITETMQVIEGLACNFANTMRSRGMPVTRVVRDSASVPVWVAVKDTNLSGEKLGFALVHTEQHYNSSAAPRYVELADAEEMALQRNETLSYYERSVGITAIGGLVAITRQFSRSGRIGDRHGHPNTIIEKPFSPSALFNTDDRINPRRLTLKMNQRLNACLGEYLEIYTAERERAGGPFQREHDYYFDKPLPIPQNEGLIDVGKPPGRLFGRRKR